MGPSSLYCSENGTWDDQIPVCVAVECENLTDSGGTHILVNYSNHPAVYRTKALFTCGEGFEIQGKINNHHPRLSN